MNLVDTLPKIWPVTAHTDYVGAGSTYVVISGQRFSGLDFVATALERGASQIVVEQSNLNADLSNLIQHFGAKLLIVPNARRALSELSAAAWNFPAQQLKILGVTGTKGKTTSVYALWHMLLRLGKSVAMISGVENWIGNRKYPAALTTPQPDYLHMFLAQCVAAQIEYVVMEASAQGLSLHRLDHVNFDAAIFTNLEMEHSEFYQNIEDYFVAKSGILNLLKPQAKVVVNADSAWGQKIIERAHEVSLTFGKNDLQNKLSWQNLSLQDGIVFAIHSTRPVEEYRAPLIAGSYNVYNLAGAVLALNSLGFEAKALQGALQDFAGAPGRLELHRLPNGARAVVDYAHTPASFQSILSLLRQETKHLILIFGAGGGKDHLKRPIMGQIALEFADLIILTNDNPRHEEPMAIVQAILNNTISDKFLIQLDRSAAIQLAYKLSRSDSMIVLLGKGPDEYQQIGDNKQFFSDRLELLNLQ